MTNTYGPPCHDCINHLDEDQCPICGFVFQREDPYWTATRYQGALQDAKKQLKNIAGICITIEPVTISQAEELKEIYRQAKIGYELIEWVLKEEV